MGTATAIPSALSRLFTEFLEKSLQPQKDEPPNQEPVHFNARLSTDRGFARSLSRSLHRGCNHHGESGRRLL